MFFTTHYQVGSFFYALILGNRLPNTTRILLIGLLALCFAPTGLAEDYRCTPTSPDAKGPFYEPDAPIRSTVGKGYVLAGQVKSAKDCSPIINAKIEFWMAGPGGEYEDAYRGTLFTDHSGNYKIESHFPPNYGFRPPHIHLQITADRYVTLVTQHYLKKGAKKAAFDIVLRPI